MALVVDSLEEAVLSALPGETVEENAGYLEHLADRLLRQAEWLRAGEPDPDDLAWARDDLGPGADEEQVVAVAGRRARERQADRPVGPGE